MEAISRTEEEYVAAITTVLDYIQLHLDDNLSPRKLADVACFSQHHFHRIFRGVVGESVMDHVRRLRLERAAYRLKSSQTAVATIAIDAGYGAQEVFTRVFRQYYGIAPRMFRRAHAAHLLPAKSGIHFDPNGFTTLRKAVDPELLQSDLLCSAHRQFPAEFEHQWEAMLGIITSFSSLVYPLRPHGFVNAPIMTENTTTIDQEIATLENEVEAAKQRLIEARKRRPKEYVDDYVFQDSDGNDVKLSELFGDKADLILVHNMGTGCAHCTMWADGFTGLVPHLSDRAAFVVCSPDKPDVQKRFAAKRNWNFKMVSCHENSFAKDMGFWQEDGPYPGPWPGASTFHRGLDGQIHRVARTSFSPNDDFCAVWPFMDMLAEGANGWEPQYNYEKKPR